MTHRLSSYERLGLDQFSGFSKMRGVAAVESGELLGVKFAGSGSCKWKGPTGAAGSEGSGEVPRFRR